MLKRYNLRIEKHVEPRIHFELILNFLIGIESHTTSKGSELTLIHTEETINAFCAQHGYGYKVLEVEDDVFWCEDRNSAAMQYAVAW